MPLSEWIEQVTPYVDPSELVVKNGALLHPDHGEAMSDREASSMRALQDIEATHALASHGPGLVWMRENGADHFQGLRREGEDAIFFDGEVVLTSMQTSSKPVVIVATCAGKTGDHL